MKDHRTMQTTGTTGGASARTVDEAPKTVKTVDQTEAAPMFAAPTKPGLPRYLWNAVHHFRTLNRHKRGGGSCGMGWITCGRSSVISVKS